MNDQDAVTQSERLKKYNQLTTLRTRIYKAIQTITENDPNGPHGQGPFTGNTRESRQVESMRIQFTETRGGAPPVEIWISDLNIEACELGRELEKLLRAGLVPINEAIIQRPGRVEAITLDGLGTMFKVVFWDNSKRESCWLYADEIEPR